MPLRKIVQIDEEKCNGCGDCIPNCPEGALKIVDGKARLVSDRYCDGLGACLGVCPRDAIRVVEREAEEFDEEAVAALTSRQQSPSPADHALHGSVCPGAALMDIACVHDRGPAERHQGESSALSQWPVQLRLVPVSAPFFQGADLLLTADCVPFALPDFHARLLRGKRLLVGCPKLDDSAYYAEKLTDILKRNDVRSLTIVHMEVPCCFGMMALARRAVSECDKRIPVRKVVVGLHGEIKETRALHEAECAAAG